MSLGTGDDAHVMQGMRRTVFIRGSAALGIETEDLIFHRLKGLKQFVDPRIKATSACGETLASHIIMQPHIFRRSDQRSSTTRGSDQQGKPHFDRTCNAEVVTAVRRKVQTEIFCHRRPVEEMRLIQRTDFTAHKLRMLRELP